MTVYEQVTERIVAQLESGVIPWRKEWKSTGRGSHLPVNFQTQKPYRGINVLLLMAAGFDDSRFLTYKQAQGIGAQVRKGEKGTPIVFWSMFDGKDADTDDARKIPFMRQYTVFHVSQCDGIPVELPFEESAFEPIPAAESLVNGYLTRENIELRHGGNGAYYHRQLDYIQVPARASFDSPDAYYSTLFHESAHSTGAKHRLDRTKGAAFGDEAYSREELVAEFSAAYLCAETGISNALVETNHAAYIQSWLRSFKNDKNMLIWAAQRAQRAADCIADRQAAPAVESIAA
jgi:antirestriction protein ArdC